MHHSQAARVGQKQLSNIRCEYVVQQASVLGSLLFMPLMSPIWNVISSFGVSHALRQQYAAVHHTRWFQVSLYTVGLLQCHTTLLDRNHLSMNPDKAEAIVIGTSARQQTEGFSGILDLQYICISFKLETCIRCMLMGVLSFSELVDCICKSSHFHLWALHHIRKHISADTVNVQCSMGDLTIATLCCTACQPRI